MVVLWTYECVPARGWVGESGGGGDKWGMMLTDELCLGEMD